MLYIGDVPIAAPVDFWTLIKNGDCSILCYIRICAKAVAAPENQRFQPPSLKLHTI